MTNADYSPDANVDDDEDDVAAPKDDKDDDEDDTDDMNFCELCGCSEEDGDELLRCEECGRLHCSSCRMTDDEGTPYCADCYEELGEG